MAAIMISAIFQMLYLKWNTEHPSDEYIAMNTLKETMAKVRNNPRYLVYECSKTRNTSCYGWSDRIAGIVTTFIISILSNRHFLIDFDTPCLLQDYLIPNHYDWRYNSSILVNKTSSFHDVKNWHHKKLDKYISGGENFNKYFKEDVVHLLMNWDFINDFRKRPNIEQDIPWITKRHQVDIYKGVYDFLFKLSPMSMHAIAFYELTQRKRNKIACAHVRVGQNPNMPNDGDIRIPMPLEVLWKYFDSLDKDQFDLFVASDSDIVKENAKKRFPNNIVDTPGSITHIDQPAKHSPREGFLKQLIDFYILTKCDVIIITAQTGFGMLATFLRDIDDGIYCWHGKRLIPCSRYTVNDVFRYGKFGIKPKIS
ncbi:uncharacterized protein [Argopecten irradians]|uniref:uncharacterized protein n=1 Tax=Argopecten irradians TaxID=31199 RepID=UPI00371542A1